MLVGSASPRRSRPGRHRGRPTLTKVVGRAVAGAVCSTVGLALGAFLGADAGAGLSSSSDRDVSGAAGAQRPASQVERLIAEHGCWTGDAPGSAIPGRAVVTLPGRKAHVVSSDVGFALWLGPDGTPGSGDERAGRLHAFCP
jgi:hypothetical protein